MGVGVALIAAAVIGAASQQVQARKQRKATREASKRAEELETQRRADEKKIRDASKQPDDAAATATFGGDDEDTVGSFDEFVSPSASRSSGVGITKGTSSGLGFSV